MKFNKLNELLDAQLEASNTALAILGGIIALGFIALVKLGPTLTEANTNTTTQVITKNITTNNTTTTKTTTTKKKATKATASSVNKKVRPVYLTSDNIGTAAQDRARMSKICSELKKKGINCSIYGRGPNTHINVLKNKNVPSDAVCVEIYGGACAGTLWEKGGKWYKSIKGNRKVFIVFVGGATKITGKAFLIRAHDDNFSPWYFAGLATPDKYLKSHGYSYDESRSVKSIVNNIYKQATS